MAELGDLIFKLLGKSDPQQQLAAALAQQPTPAMAGSTPGAGASTPAPAAGAPATSTPGSPAAAPPPPPPPSTAPASPPDLVTLYSKLMERENANHSIDRGLGLLGAAFAHPDNRAAIINAYGGGAGGASAPSGTSLVNNLLALHKAQTDMQHQAEMRTLLPNVATQMGIDQDTAKFMLDAGSLDDVMKFNMQHPEKVKEYDYYIQQTKKTGGTPMPFDKFLQVANKGSLKYGMSPQYTLDADGNVHMVQLGNNGTAVEPKLPDGQRSVQKAIKVDTGTETLLINPFDNTIMARIPMNVAGKAKGEAVGKAAGEAAAALPDIESKAKMALDLVEQQIKDPELDKVTGLHSWTNISQWLPGTPAHDFVQRNSQLQAKEFEQAYQTLKGGGAISDYEDQRASAAISNLSTSQSPAAYRENLRVLEQALRNGVLNKRRVANGLPPVYTDPNDPKYNLDKVGGGRAPDTAAPPPPTASAGGDDAAKQAQSVKAIQDAARESIKKGAAKDAVVQRLREHKIPVPEDLQ